MLKHARGGPHAARAAILVLVALALTTPVHAGRLTPYEQTRQATRRDRAQLKGLSGKPLAPLAVWRDRSLRTPEVARAISRIRRFLNDRWFLGQRTRALPLAGTRLVLTDQGEVRALEHGYTLSLTSSSVRGISARSVVAQILAAAEQLGRGEAPRTITAYPEPVNLNGD